MQFSRKSDYALRAIRHISSLPKGKLGSINSIAEAEPSRANSSPRFSRT